RALDPGVLLHPPGQDGYGPQWPQHPPPEDVAGDQRFLVRHACEPAAHGDVRLPDLRYFKAEFEHPDQLLVRRARPVAASFMEWHCHLLDRRAVLSLSAPAKLREARSPAECSS
ncbi:unnamed protein product, partial [Symbiodinium sp. CCMP2456]